MKFLVSIIGHDKKIYTIPKVHIEKNKKEEQKAKKITGEVTKNISSKVTFKENIKNYFSELAQDIMYLNDDNLNISVKGKVKFKFNTDFSIKPYPAEKNTQNIENDKSLFPKTSGEIIIEGNISNNKNFELVATVLVPHDVLQVYHIPLSIFTYIGKVALVINDDISGIIDTFIPTTKKQLNDTNLSVGVYNNKRIPLLMYISYFKEFIPLKSTVNAFNMDNDDMGDISNIRIGFVASPRIGQMHYNDKYNFTITFDWGLTENFHNIFLSAEFIKDSFFSIGAYGNFNSSFFDIMDKLNKILRQNTLFIFSEIKLEKLKIPLLSSVFISINLCNMVLILREIYDQFTLSPKALETRIFNTFLCIIGDMIIMLEIFSGFKIAIEYFCDANAFSISLKPDVIKISHLLLKIWRRRVVFVNKNAILYDNKLLELKTKSNNKQVVRISPAQSINKKY